MTDTLTLPLAHCDRCDKCGMVVAHIDQGFSPALQGMLCGGVYGGPGCGGAFRPAEVTVEEAMELIVTTESPEVRRQCEELLNSGAGQAALDAWEHSG